MKDKFLNINKYISIRGNRALYSSCQMKRINITYNALFKLPKTFS